MTARDLTKALRGRWHGFYGTARCPAHDDRNPSLSISERDGKLLVSQNKMMLGPCSGGAVRLAPQDVELVLAETIHVVQSKTGTKLWIPVHAELRAALDASERVSPVIITTATGKPYTGPNFRHHFGKVMKAADVNGVSFHGLRAKAANKLAEAGCTSKEIAAITGHRSLSMVEHYTREADQRRLASAAIHRLENASGTKTGKPR